MTAPRVIAGTAPLLIIVDHASNHVPPGVDLAIDPGLLDNHIAIDIGSAELAEGLAAELGATAILATVSRLVIDMNRDPCCQGLVPTTSDGHVIPGNLALSATDRDLRVRAIHAPYHESVAAEIAARRPALLISLHSFTPKLAVATQAVRPWPVGILYNTDARAAQLALAMLAARGLHVGDNQPYSGRDLNYTMNRHAEATGIPYLGFEIRNDLLRDTAGIRQWTRLLADTIHHCCRQRARHAFQTQTTQENTVWRP
jgi:predicted N-formylglutamate amidohydrolase